MATRKEGLAGFFRGIERRLGIDREGRTVWVWLLPPAVGIVSAVLVAFMPGLPTDLGWVYRLAVLIVRAGDHDTDRLHLPDHV